VLPSLFILIALSWIYMAFGDVPVVAGIFYGIKPAVTALVRARRHRIGSRALKNGWLWASRRRPSSPSSRSTCRSRRSCWPPR
jgi:chromate transporter